MRLRIVFLALAAAIPALPQTTSPPPPLLDTGLPNAYPTPPPPITGASSTSPLLTPSPAQAAVNPPSGGTTPCKNTTIPCVLTAQVTNSRQNVSLEDKLMATYVTGAAATKQQFQVDQTGVPTSEPANNTFNRYRNNPVYAQPLYVSNLTNTIPGVSCVNGNICNVLYVAT